MSKLTILVMLAALIALTTSIATADVPQTMTYQGQLSNSVGEPITATLPMEFTIYDDSTGGNPLWVEGHPAVDVEEGLFSVLLGFDNPIPDTAFAPAGCWIETIVDGELIEPRTLLTSTPYTYSSRSINGDVTTQPGELTIAEPSRQDRYMSFRSVGGTNNFSMVQNGPSEEGRFSMFDVSGGSEPVLELTGSGEVGGMLQMGAPNNDYPILDMRGDPTWGGSIKMGDPGDQRTLVDISASAAIGGRFQLYAPTGGLPVDPIMVMETEVTGPLDCASLKMFNPLSDPPHDPLLWMRSSGNGGEIVMAEEGVDPDSAMFSALGMAMFQDGSLVMELLSDGVQFNFADCGRALTNVKYNKCGVAFEDTSGETLMVANETGVRVASPSGKSDSWASITGAGVWVVEGDSWANITGSSWGAGLGGGEPISRISLNDFELPGGYFTGNVGVGVEIPSEAFEVNGKVYSTDGGFKFPDGTVQTTAAGGTTPGCVQAVDITDGDTLYNGTTKSFISATIDCPAAGYVLAIGSCDALVRHHAGAGDPRFMFGVSNTPTTLDGDQRKEWYFQDAEWLAGLHSIPISSQKVFSTSSGPNTFYMNGYRSVTTGCNDSCWIDNKTLTLIFIPVSYGTVEESPSTGQEPLLTDDVVEPSQGAVSVVARQTAGGITKTERIDLLESQVRELTEIVNQLRENQR